MIELIIFAVIAGLLIARLNSVLGQKNEGDEFRGSHTFKRDNNTPRDAKGGERDNVITLPGYDNPSQAALNTGDDDLPVSVNEQLKRIHMIDGQFDEDHFTSGVRVAFPMIVEAFAANDKDTLSTLLDDNIYQDFAAAIDDRAEANETLSTEIREVHDISIIEAKTNNNMLEITVRIISDQVNELTREQAEHEGKDAEPATVEITDIWTFARPINSDNPNWKLIETRVDP